MPPVLGPWSPSSRRLWSWLVASTCSSVPWATTMKLAWLSPDEWGALIERAAIRPMLGESPISSFMVTVGLSSILVGVVEMVWTADQKRLPEFFPQAPVMVGEALVSAKVFWGFCAAALLIAAAIVALRYWRGGVALRATASDQAAAYSMGINVPRVFSLAWIAAAMIACVAGIVVGSIGGISSAMGVFGLSVLVVVIFGGLDSVPGALVGGLVVGVIESLEIGRASCRERVSSPV